MQRTPLWSRSQVAAEVYGEGAVRAVEALQRRGLRTILCLGRWEPGCYKNSEEAFNLLRGVRKAYPETVLLILTGSELPIPSDLQGAVYPLGFPDDFELLEVMQRVDAGISPSLWEGFNLPLAEMQWLDRPAFALNCGAHPEVILDSWYLSADINEMASKAHGTVRRRRTLRFGAPDRTRPLSKLFSMEPFRKRLRSNCSDRNSCPDPGCN